MGLVKDEALLAILGQLRRDLGADAFVIEDHWEADSNAIGIARPEDRRYLIYVSIWPSGSGLSFECESPSEGADIPYEPSGMIDCSTYAQLLVAAREHLFGG
jgi:hypothetical protein